MYIKAALNLTELNDLLDNHPEVVKTGRGGTIYMHINIEISKWFDQYGQNVSIRPYMGRNENSSIEKSRNIGRGSIDIQKMKEEIYGFDQ